MYNSNFNKDEGIKKSNEYYMSVGVQKTEIKKIRKSPFGILSFLLFLSGFIVCLFVNQPYIAIILEAVALVFAIIHLILKKKGIPWLIFSILGVVGTIILLLLPDITPGIYNFENTIPIVLQLFAKETEPTVIETESETETETEATTEVMTETEKETINQFNGDLDYISNSNWQLSDDLSCLYFLQTGNYYWCKEKDNFDDNYYYGSYTLFKGEEAIAKLQELDFEDMEQEIENISQFYIVEMTNDLCYMNGEDISIEYKETKPIRNYAFLIDSPYTGKGCDLEKYRDNGFINLSKIANANLSIIKEPNFETEELTENDTEETLETEQTES